MVEYVCIRADVGLPSGTEGKVFGILPADGSPDNLEADTSDEWKTVGCLNPIALEAVSPDTVDKIKQVAEIAAKHLPDKLAASVVEAAKAGTRPFTAGGMDAVLKQLPPIAKKVG